MNPSTTSSEDSDSPMPAPPVTVMISGELSLAYINLQRAVEKYHKAGHHCDAMADALAAVQKAQSI